MSDKNRWFGVSTRALNHGAVEGAELPFVIQISGSTEEEDDV